MALLALAAMALPRICCSHWVLLLVVARTSRAAPIDQKLRTSSEAPDVSGEQLTSNEVELTELAWVSVELSDLRVSIKTLECYHFSKYISPLLSVSLEDAWAAAGGGDGDAPQRRAQTWRLTADWRLPAGVDAGRFVTYYYRNASLLTQLVGHNKDFRDPLRKPEILARSQPVSLAAALSQGRLQMRGQCYNVTAKVTPLDMASLVPTTTVDPVAAMAAARAVESPLYHVSMEGGGPLARAAAPLWMLLLAAVVFILLLVAFVMLFVVHLRARKRYAGSTCSGLSPASFASKPASSFSHRSHSASGCRSLKLTCATANHHNGNGSNNNNNVNMHMVNGSSHTLSHANTSGSTIYQFPAGVAQQQHAGGCGVALQLPPAPPVPLVGLKHPTVVRAHSNSDAESHYDVPWDHKYRPLPDWLRTDLASSLANDGRPAHTVAVRPVPPPGATILCDSGVEST